MERTINLDHSRMNVFFHHFTGDYAGLGLIATLILTIPVQEIGILLPAASGVLVLIGQGIRWYRDDQRKQKRHELFLKIADKMVSGEIAMDKDFLEKLDED